MSDSRGASDCPDGPSGEASEVNRRRREGEAADARGVERASTGTLRARQGGSGSVARFADEVAGLGVRLVCRDRKARYAKIRGINNHFPRSSRQELRGV